MKTKALTTAAAIALGAAGWCAGQYAEDMAYDAELAPKEKEPWGVSLTLRGVSISHSHDALQHRADYDDKTRQHWQNGESSGDGWGFTLAVTQAPRELILRHERLTHDFRAEQGANRHDLHTQRQEWELTYRHTKEGKTTPGELGAWGWQVGFRHIYSEKKMRIREGAAVLETEGDSTWKLLQGGYWGLYRPLAGPVRLFGGLNFHFGEVDGLARSGNDKKRDGRIRETYRPDQGLAYGLSLDAGLGADFLKYFQANIGYRREWLYSFQATDSGVVVVPDNDDALFIENLGGFYAEVGARIRF